MYRLMLDSKRKLWLAAFLAVSMLAIFILLVSGRKEPKMEEASSSGLQLVSAVFREGAVIPIQYTCKGQNVNPPLNILHPPVGTQSFSLIMHDPDAPSGDFLHWLVWDIPPSTEGIAVNSVPVGAMQGYNGSDKVGYMGPCPPAGTGMHRYVFELYALDKTMDLGRDTNRQDLENAMKEHVLDKSTLTGVFGTD